MQSCEIVQNWKNSQMEVKMESILKAIEEKVAIAVCPGVYFSTRESIELDQANWSDFDDVKEMDFSGYPFWIITDDGKDPKGFNTIEESLKFVGIDIKTRKVQA